MLTQLYLRGRVLLVLALIGVTALIGQGANGTISGTVTDPSGVAMVQVKNLATQVARTVTTNAPSRNCVPELRVGSYDAVEAAQVDTSSSAVSNLVETKQIQDIPLDGRNYTQLITLAPRDVFGVA